MREVKSDVKIRFEDKIYGRLMAYSHAYRGEFSGVGFCRRETKEIIIYDFVLMDVGSSSYTEFSGAKMLPLLERSDAGNMKAWLHKHPVGDGIPGAHNWSSTDVRTAELEPFASPPELVHWSVSVVLTPRGWVGRLDNYDKQITAHLEVVQPSAFREIEAIVREKALKAPKVETRLVSNWGETGRLLAARHIPEPQFFNNQRQPLLGAGRDWTHDVVEEEWEDNADQDVIDFLWDTFLEEGDLTVKETLKLCMETEPQKHYQLSKLLDTYPFKTLIHEVLENEGIDCEEIK